MRNNILIPIILLVASGAALAQADSAQGKSLRAGAFLDEYQQQIVNQLLFPDFIALPVTFDPQPWLKIGTPTHTVLIGDSIQGCPKATALTGVAGNHCGIYAGYVGQVGALTLVTPLTSLTNDFTNLDLITGRTGSIGWSSTGSDQGYWDGYITHGSHFDSATPWIWPDNCLPSAPGNCTAALGFLIFHSDCLSRWITSTIKVTSPCSSTNDYGYNPPGRQACSHGPIETDQLDVATYGPLPNMGYRNVNCDGSVLGFPAPNAPIPVTPAAYPLTNQAAYNDIANMYILSTYYNGQVSGGSAGAVVQMGNAHIDGSSNCYGAGCPNDGVHNIVLQDYAIVSDPTEFDTFPLDISAVEWLENPNPQPFINAMVNAAPYNLYFSEGYFASDADDDGFGVNLIAATIRIGCAFCSVTHSYIGKGSKRDNSEGHNITMAPPGPNLLADNWCEGDSICFWGGGGGTPTLCGDQSGGGSNCDSGLRAQNLESARNILTANLRWATSPAGIQGDTNNVLSWVCSGSNAVLTLKSSVGNPAGGNIYWPIIFLETSPSGSGLAAPLWYTAGNLNGSGGLTSGTTVTIPSPSCSGGGSGGSIKIYGFEACVGGGPASGSGGCGPSEQPLGSISVTALNNLSCGSKLHGKTDGVPGPNSYYLPCDPISHQANVDKNTRETKAADKTLVWGEIWENEPVQGQEGQLSSSSVRACGGVSKCAHGRDQNITNELFAHIIARHANQGLLHDGRSGTGGNACYSDATGPCPTANQTLSSVTCNSTNASGTAIDFVFSAAAGFTSADTGLRGTDIYVYNVAGPDPAPLPNGWYQTLSPAPGHYGTKVTVYLPGGVNCPVTGGVGHSYSAVGTLTGLDNADGGGVSTGMIGVGIIDALIYDIGDHTRFNGGGSGPSITTSSNGNNLAIHATMGPASGTACTSHGLAAGTIAPGVACAQVTAIDACPAANLSSQGPILPDCPDTLQAQTGDLEVVVCQANQGFSTVAPWPASTGGGLPPVGIGAPIIDLDPNQLWFTYTPTPPSGFSLPAGGAVTDCPIEPPNGSPKWTLTLAGNVADTGSSGVYNGQSYPKNTFFSHITSVAMNGGAVAGQSYQVNSNWMNGFLLSPGTGDVNVPGIAGGTQKCGGSVSCGFQFPQATYTGPPTGSCQGYLVGTGNCTSKDSCGITGMGQEASLTFQAYAVGSGSPTNYPTWTGSSPYCWNDGYAVGENSTPLRVSTPGPRVTCSGAACTPLNDSPDSVGFVGAMSTNNYPLNLRDFRGYGLHSSSPYVAGALLGATDGFDNGFVVPLFIDANARTIRTCPLLVGCPTFYHDGPQYEWLTWSCSGTCSSFQIFEDGLQVLTTSNTYAQVYGLAINSSHVWNVTSTSGVVLALAATMY